MREIRHRFSLKKASAYQEYRANPYHDRRRKAAQKFHGQRILPIVIFWICVEEYIKQKIRNYKKNYRDEDHEDLEKDALRANNKIANFTIVLAIVGGLGLYENWRVLRAIEGQLGEMQSSSAQTDRIIAADNNLASAAREQAVAAAALSKTTEQNLELSQRAWIGPINAKIEPIVEGKPVRVAVEYQNTGKEPAEVQIIVAQQIFPESDFLNIDKGYAFMRMNQERCSKSEKFSSYFVAFPIQQPNFYVAYSDSSTGIKFVADADLMSGKKVDIVIGCFIYKSFNKIRHTFFAYYYKAGETKDVTHLSFYPFIGYAD